MKYVAKNRETMLDEAQLMELFRRSRISVLFSVPALLTGVFVHAASAPFVHSMIWFGPMLLIQIGRLATAQINLASSGRTRPSLPWTSIETGLAALAGTGWASLLFILDTHQLDFLFLFKFATLAAALGVVMNALSAVLRIYASFVATATGVIVAYLLTQASFLQPLERNSMVFGTLVYAMGLLMVGRNVSMLTRTALDAGFKREEALTQLEIESEQLNALNLKLHNLSRSDPLTGICNRRYLQEQLSREILASQRYHSVFSVILIDIDNFKSINDTRGHGVGDQVLVGFSGAVARQLREVDFFGRWGGEEFICLLPNIAIDEALVCAERLRQVVEESRLVDDNLVVTASFGVATYRSGDDADSIVNAADKFLYLAKETGKNRVLGDIAALP